MQYNAPPGSSNADAPYVNGIPGVQRGSPVNAHAIEYPQREILSVIAAAGITPTNNEMDQLLKAIIDIIDARAVQYDISQTLDYFLCWHIFKGIHPSAKSGMVPVNGTLLTDAATLYPQAFAYLQTGEGQLLCTTESAWQAAHAAYWATLADGSTVGWQNIGGICKYVLDANAGTIRVPDLRGMTDEVAGYDTLDVAGVHGDATRNVTQSWGDWLEGPHNQGIAYTGANSYNIIATAGGTYLARKVLVNFSRSLPTANKFQTRAWGALACVYLGQPAS
jgi:hypothetical protein